jgi:hypothetical protein
MNISFIKGDIFYNLINNRPIPGVDYEKEVKEKDC